MNGPARTSTVDPLVLSPRERQTLIALAQGYTNRQIAAAMQPLPISVKTIDSHRIHLLKKLGLLNNADLTLYAVQQKLIDVEGNEFQAADTASDSGATVAA